MPSSTCFRSQLFECHTLREVYGFFQATHLVAWVKLIISIVSACSFSIPAFPITTQFKCQAKCLVEFVWNGINIPCYTLFLFAVFVFAGEASAWVSATKRTYHRPCFSFSRQLPISIAFPFCSHSKWLFFACLFLFSRFGLLNIYCVWWASATICFRASCKDFSPAFPWLLSLRFQRAFLF